MTGLPQVSQLKRQKKKAFCDWATTGIPVKKKAFYDWATTGIPIKNSRIYTSGVSFGKPE